MYRLEVLDPRLRDARYALRVLRKSPAFTLTASLTLAIAIGVNTAVFSVIDGVLLRPLPFPEPHRLALVSRSSGPGAAETSQNGRTWENVRDRAVTVDRAVFSLWTTGVNVVVERNGSRRVQRVQQQRVGAGFFGVLGVTPSIGREFQAAEDRPGGPQATILSAALWRSAFNGDRLVVGRTIALRGEQHEVIGVMPDGFQSGERADLWTPLRPTTSGEGDGENYHIAVRLRSGITWPQAAEEITRIGVDMQRARPPSKQPPQVFAIVPMQEGLTGAMRRPLLILWAAVGLVLVVACVNLAGLILARASGRTRELATRLALGSGRAAVVRQLVTEAIVLGLLGGAAGIALGAVALIGLKTVARDAFTIWQPVSLDGRAVAAAALLSMLASVLFGLAPALQASRLDVQAALAHGGGRSVAGGASRRTRRVLVAAQVALGVVLLVCAGLLLRTFTHLRGLNPGFDPRNLVTASVSLEDARYKTSVGINRFVDESLAAMQQIPGVESAAVSLGLPYERVLNLGFRRIAGGQPAAGGSITSATYVTPDYFTALRLPVRRGRAFDARDTAGAPGVVIVNDSFAKTYYPGDDPLGQRIAFMGREREIVGVAGDMQVKPGWGNHGPLAPMPIAYVPVSQTSDGTLRLVHSWFSPTFIVRSSGSFSATTAGMRRALDHVDPLLPFAEVRSMADVKGEALAQQRFMLALLIALAVTAVILAAIGVHGLIATSVSERTREIGIRLALGATLPQAMRTLALPGILLASAGVLVGSVAALAAVRLLRHFVWGVSISDPVTFVAVGVFLLSVATFASFVPATRILRMDPASTLRAD
jgi:predicted permease